MKVLFAPLHGVTATHEQLDHAFELNPDILGSSEDYPRRVHDYLATKDAYRLRTGTSKFVDLRGRRTAWDSALLVKKEYPEVSHGSFVAARASTPFKIAPRRHIVWDLSLIDRHRVLAINTHTHARLGNANTDRWRKASKQMNRLEHFVRTMERRYPSVAVVVMGDFNYAPNGPNRPNNPKNTFARLGMDWIYSEQSWIAWNMKFLATYKKVHPRKEVGQDHTWIEVDLTFK